MPESPDQETLAAMSESERLDDLTPRQVVAELDRYIVGQNEAKRAVAIALRNRWRRRQLPKDLADEVLPKNILMIGPTGVGKTEIARRLARLTGSPFLKIEATKYTEVGYVGRDCESMIRDLVEIAIEMEKRHRRQQMRASTERAVEDRLVDALVKTGAVQAESEGGRGRLEAREDLRRQLREKQLEERLVEIEVQQATPPAFKIGGAPGMDEIDVRLGEMMPGVFAPKTRSETMNVEQARGVLFRQEEEADLAKDDLALHAIQRVEQSGIVFLDEIDKIAVSG